MLCLLFGTLALAQEPTDDARFGLSVGTGPRPFQALTLGLTGLGARVFVPTTSRVTPWLGASATVAKASSFDEGFQSDAVVVGASAVHASGGIRADTRDPADHMLIPYVLVGGLAGRVSVWEKYKEFEERFSSGSTSFGLFAGLGLDAFLTPDLSIGGEFGGFGAVSTGSSKTVFAGSKDKGDALVGTTVITTYSSLMITVWR